MDLGLDGRVASALPFRLRACVRLQLQVGMGRTGRREGERAGSCAFRSIPV